MASGFTILKGCPIPLREPGGGVRFSVEAPVEEFREYLLSMREFLVAALRLAGEPKGETRLELLADLVAIYLKAPLLLEPIPGLSLSPFKAYVTWRILSVNPAILATLSGSLYDVTSGLYGALEDPELRRLLEKLESAARGAERIFVSIPADTRPGYNCSSLLIHLLTVSALAWAAGVQRGLGSRRDLAILRLAALLHDVGKPIEPRRHSRAGVDITSDLLKGLIPAEDMERVKRLIELHHAPESDTRLDRELRPLVTAIRDADRASAAIDRLDAVVEEAATPIIAKALRKSRDEVFDSLYRRGGPEAWTLWETVPPDVIREATEACAQRLAEPLPLTPEGRPNPLSHVHFLLLDVAGIQEFVWESEKLSVVSASSYIVDLAVSFNALRFLQAEILRKRNVWFPAEGFLYSAGGNILAAVPEDLAEDVEEILRKAFSSEGLGDLGSLEVRIVRTSFEPDYRSVHSKLEDKLLKEKLSVSDYPKDGLTGLEKPCEFCGKRAATEQYEVGDEVRDVCKVCLARFRFFVELGHLKGKWTSAKPHPGRRDLTIEQVFGGLRWDGELYQSGRGVSVRVCDRILEIIAGHDPEEFKERNGEPVRRLNLALLKIDGNLMGAFMAKSFSISDALERSARIDLALKKAFRRAFERYVVRGVMSARNEGAGDFIPYREAARLLLGLQYMGGDDCLIFAPSWAALPLATTLILEFAREMGHHFDSKSCRSYGATLSVGILVAPVKQNVWMLLSAVDRLLEVAKSVGRLPCYDGALAFDVVERGALTGGVVETRLEEAVGLGLSGQPWVLSLRELPEKLECDVMRSLRRSGPQSQVDHEVRRNGLRLLEFTLGISLSDSSDSGLESFLESAFKSAYEVFQVEKSGEGASRAKLIRDVLREIQEAPGLFSLSPGDDGYLQLVRLYLVRQISREEDEERRRLMRGLFSVLSEWFKPAPLDDLSKACKILMGGAG